MVAERAAMFEINPINSFGSRVEKKSKFVLTLTQRLFRPLAPGDVLNCAAEPDDLSAFISLARLVRFPI